jgi:hypothetical protein
LIDSTSKQQQQGKVMTITYEKFGGGTAQKEVGESLQTALNVAGASGNGESFDTRGRRVIAWLAELTALTGGTAPTLAFTWQHSHDGVTWFDIATEATLAVLGFKQRIVQENLLRFLRIAWVTTGAPATAVATFAIQAG